MSLLGILIQVKKMRTMEMYSRAITEAFIEAFEANRGEGANLQDFVLYLSQESEHWDAVCELNDILTKQQLSQEVGIIIKFCGPKDAEVRWSGF